MTESLEDMIVSLHVLTWPDYLVFSFMLLICIVIGVYFGFFHVSTNSTDYLVGGRSMKVFPVAMSLIASFISGISLLGTPTEIYVYGIQYIYISGGIVIMGVVWAYVYLPVFHNLKLTSSYEYLEKRFDKRIRLFGSILFSIGIITWLPIVIYVPALAFNQVTGVNVHIITPAVCVVCIFYTCMGGLKAVIWTDVIQTLVMFGSMVLVTIKGTLDLGGFNVVWQRNLDSDRIELPELDIDPLARHTLWSLAIGGFIYWLQTSAVNQTMLQRYLALPTLKAAVRALWVFIVGILLLLGLCSYSGMLIFATYYNCDPLTTKLAKAKDQLLPLLVMDTLGEWPGFPGMFVAGVFSAALSSLSTGLNSMAAVVLEDFVKPFARVKLTAARTDFILKLVVVVIGVACVGLAFVVEKMGTVLQLSMSLSSITSGPSLGIFSMGILLPWVSAKGALFGGLAGLGFMSWLCLNVQAAIATGSLKFVEKPVTTEGCHYHFTPRDPPVMSLTLETPLNITSLEHNEEIFMLYRLSYLWYTLLGAAVSMTVGVLISWCTKWNDPRDIEPALLSPVIRRFITPKSESTSSSSTNNTLDVYTQNPTLKIEITSDQSVELQNVRGPESA